MLRLPVGPRLHAAYLSLSVGRAYVDVRSKLIRARDEDGTQVVILEIEGRPATEVPPRYELANRSKVERISETEFVVIQTGRRLRKLKS